MNQTFKSILAGLRALFVMDEEATIEEIGARLDQEVEARGETQAVETAAASDDTQQVAADTTTAPSYEELQQENAALRTQVESLQTRLEALEARLAAVESMEAAGQTTGKREAPESKAQRPYQARNERLRSQLVNA
ncbi:MAG: hypothetical protein KDC54_07505 [Lewinella sp.]|nr:hypothetical protein [Lewinella sp.]